MIKKAVLLILMLFISGLVFAAEKNKTRLGLGASMFSSGSKEEFKQYGIYGYRDLPWMWNISAPLNLKTKISGSAGNVGTENERAFYFSIGPSVDFCMYEDKILLNSGVNPTVITKKNFNGIHLGGPLQFTVYAEAYLQFIPNFSVGFRTQHISNANIYKDNHGFNTYMLLLNFNLDK